MKPSNQAMHPLHEVSEGDAIGMLIADHKRVASLFADFHRLNEQGRDREKASVVKEICQELIIHTQLEEELFYPAVRKAIADEDQMDEAIVEHAGAKLLIAQLKSADPKDALYDAKVTVLGEQIDHHVAEEEGSMFPKARYSGLDTLALGTAMLRRKRDLLSATPARTAAGTRLREIAADAEEDENEFLNEGLRKRVTPQRRLATQKAAKRKAAKQKASPAVIKRGRR
jgi:hemerythrin superfamily protein